MPARPSSAGSTVIDTDTREVAAFIPTGVGHHEVAFSPDDRYAYVSNRKAGTVTVIDIGTLTKVEEIETGPLPISIAYSSRAKALYVADGQRGEIAVIDGAGHKVRTRIATEPGLGPMRFSQDGRWGIVVNSEQDAAYVIDPATNELAYTLAVGDRPYQVAFTRAFAYIRSLGTERVSMIELQHLGRMEKPPVVGFPAGAKAPGLVADPSIADQVTEAAGEAAVLAVSPADNTVYYYMEGMNAPMGNFPQLRAPPAGRGGGGPHPQGEGAGDLHGQGQDSRWPEPTTWPFCWKPRASCTASTSAPNRTRRSRSSSRRWRWSICSRSARSRPARR